MGFLDRVKNFLGQNNSKVATNTTNPAPQSNIINGLKEGLPIASVKVNLSKEEATKQLVNLKKTAEKVILSKGIGGQKARVVLVIDISGSMSGTFARGEVQRASERLLALAMNFDDNGAADVFAFDAKSYDIGEISQDNFYEFVEREILAKFHLGGATLYAPPMKSVVALSRIPGDPVYCLFITDGDAYDANDTVKIVKDVSHLPIYWQFVGIGKASFALLKQLGGITGRTVNNTGFFQLDDLDAVEDEVLYNRMLADFPRWLREAKNKGVY